MKTVFLSQDTTTDKQQEYLTKLYMHHKHIVQVQSHKILDCVSLSAEQA